MDNESPLISIVLPTYNGGRYLKLAIESCLEQTYRNIELVIVIDGSTDNTREIIASFSDNRIKIIEHGINLGLPTTLNTGFINTNGQYLTWTSDDNLYDKNALEVMLGFLTEHARVDFVYCDYWEIDKNGVTGEMKRVGEPEFIMDICLVGACFLYRRKVYEIIGDYDPDTRLAEDYDYWMRVSKKFTMSTLHQPLYFYRIHDSALSGSSGIGHKRWRIITQSKRTKLGMKYLNYQKETSKIDIDEAFSLYKSGNYRQVPALVLKGLLRNPAWIKNRGVLSIAGKSISKLVRSLITSRDFPSSHS